MSNGFERNTQYNVISADPLFPISSPDLNQSHPLQTSCASPTPVYTASPHPQTPAELGINPSHILAKSLTVLNPLSKPDERIMDDADLAGPFVFCFGFALVLLLVSTPPPRQLSTKQLIINFADDLPSLR